MPKERIFIDRFYGMPADAESERPGSAGYAVNMDPAVEENALVGLPGDTELTTLNDFDVLTQFGDDLAVGTRGTTVILYDFKDDSQKLVQSPLIPSVSITPSVTSDGQAVHIGLGTNQIPRWAGYAHGDRSLFRVEHAWLENPRALVTLGIVWGTQTTNGPFDNKTTYFWGVSFGYDDGLQEGPLAKGTLINTPAWYDYIDNGEDLAMGYDKATITVTGLPAVNPRIRYVYLYRAEAPGLDAVRPDSAYEFVKEIAIDPENPGTLEFVDDHFIGQSYDDRTGLSETMDHQGVRYGLSAEIDGYHMVSHVAVGTTLGSTEISNGNQAIYRSQPYRFDMFNWASDFLDLDAKPTALVGFQGRLYAFTSGSLYIIAPGTLTVEERLEGIGTFSRGSVVVTDRGMFWASEKNIYWHTGERILPIGSALNKRVFAQGLEWGNQAFDVHPVVLYSAAQDMILIYYKGLQPFFPVVPIGLCLGFSIRDQDWRMIGVTDLGTITAGYITTSARVITSLTNQVYERLSDYDNRREAQWWSPWLDRGGALCRYTKARVFGGDHEFGYREGSQVAPNWMESLAASSDQKDPITEHVPNLSPGSADPLVLWGAVRSLQVRIIATEPEKPVRALELVRRTLGVR